MAISDDLPLMRGLPRGDIPDAMPLILASTSPRRSQLLAAAGYDFSVRAASEQAECGMCSRETAPQLVARYAYRKAESVVVQIQASRLQANQLQANRSSDQSASGTLPMVLAADTVASCNGQILGKPVDEQHAATMLRMLSGRRHDVYSGICLWSAGDSRCAVDVVRTELQMSTLSDSDIRAYLETMLWEGKAGGFGFQDGNDWIKIVPPDSNDPKCKNSGSESNVVGLPMERLKEMLENFDTLADTIDTTHSEFASSAKQ